MNQYLEDRKAGISRNIDNQKAFLENFTGWYAPSMFGTSYGKLGYKIEVEAYRYENGQMKEHNGYNCDGKTYQQAKNRFWFEWNQDHKGQTLNIGKFMSSWGF